MVVLGQRVRAHARGDAAVLGGVLQDERVAEHVGPAQQLRRALVLVALLFLACKNLQSAVLVCGCTWRRYCRFGIVLGEGAEQECAMLPVASSLP